MGRIIEEPRLKSKESVPVALLSGSACIDAAGETAPATDQRGYVRPAGTRSDVGAFEAEALPPSPAKLLVTGTILQRNKGVAGVRVQVGGQVTYTDSFGKFEAVADGNRVLVQPGDGAYRFRPAKQIVRVIEGKPTVVKFKAEKKKGKKRRSRGVGDNQ